MTGGTKPKVLALVPLFARSRLRQQLTEVAESVIFIGSAVELSGLEVEYGPFHVALLPAALPDTDWWLLWRDLALTSPRAAILVYAQSADFELWSGVLEAGGYDVVIEPFQDEVLQKAVLRAFESIQQDES